MSLPRALVILMVATAVHSRAAESVISQIADWPGLVAQAKERGVDYRASVARAEKGNTNALKTVFRITPYTDGAAALMHCAVLRKLLDKIGDATFSQVLRSQSPTLRTKVVQAIDFDFGKPWQKYFPATYALGTHDTRLLRGKQ